MERGRSVIGSVMEVRFKYVHEDEDRHGNLRVYFKRPGGRKIRLRAKPSTSEFQAEYDAALDATSTDISVMAAVRSSVESTRGTLGWLCHVYVNSVEFKTQLGERTKSVRRRIYENAMKEPIAPGAKETFRDFPLGRLSRKAIKVLRDRKAETPEAANDVLKAFRQLFKWAISEEIDGVTVHDTGLVRGGIVTFSREGVSAKTIRAALSARKVNTSLSNIYSTYLDDTWEALGTYIRASVHYVTTDEEIDRLIDAIPTA